MTPEEAQAYKANVIAHEQSLIDAETVSKSIGWLEQLRRDYPHTMTVFYQHIQENRKTRVLYPAIAAYKTLTGLTPEERQTWTCTPMRHDSLKRLNEEARPYYQQLQRKRRESELTGRYQQLSLDLFTQDHSR